MRYTALITRILCLVALTLAPSAHANDSEKLDKILELMTQQQEQISTLSAEVERLKAEEAQTEEQPSAKAETTEEPSRTIKRKSGWITSVHPATGGKAQAAMGRMVVDGFPMRQDIGKVEFGIENNEIAYRSRGELKISEDGEHSFSVRTTNNSSTFRCSFKFEIEGQPVFDITKMRKSTHTAEVDLTAGYYQFTMYQWCQISQINWEMGILEPSGMNPIPLTSEYVYHRVK